MVGKKIGLGVSAGIAAYKSCELIRLLKKAGAEVRVIVTPRAAEFVSELTFATLSGNPVYRSMYQGLEGAGGSHIDLARWCDLFVVCPSTADLIGRINAGIADDLLTTMLLATEAETIICPAMNSVMWGKAVVQDNIRQLKQRGYRFIDPEWGDLATSSEGQGWGRLASLETIMDEIERGLASTKEFFGRHVLVTAGSTCEPIDPVRFLTNYSTGKMGFAIAKAAKFMGAKVTLIAGPNNLKAPSFVDYIPVNTALEMSDAVHRKIDSADIVIMAAAVADYRPQEVAEHKIKKSDGVLEIKFMRNPDILAEAASKKGKRIHVGFALETENGYENALSKLQRKKLDFICLNNPLEDGAAFAGDTNVISILDANGEVERLSKMSKKRVAEHILKRLSSHLLKSQKK